MRLLPILIALSVVACDDEPATNTDTSVTTETTADATASTDTDTLDEDGRPQFETGNAIITEPALTTEDRGDGVTRGVVDATREEGWVQVNLGDGAQVTTEAGWDLAFQRILIRVSHPIAAVDQAFETVTQAPADGYVTDGETLAFEQLGEWWDYNFQNHTVSPKVKTFVIKIDDETYFKLAVRDYYDDAGTTGSVTLDWASVSKP